MGRTVSVSFEGSNVKVVHASLKGGSLSVDKAEVISDAGFDYYLQKEKAREFIVTCEFRGSYHGIVSTPIVKSKYIDKIIESEIRKATEKKDLTFIYVPLGEGFAENRKVLEFFYYAVSNEELRTVLSRFYDNGKTVRSIYPSVFSAVSVLDSRAPDEAYMGAFSSDRARVVFFIKDGLINFIRNYESYEAELGDFDIQNINMTVSYCFQNLKINPSSVLLMGNLSASSGISVMPSAPLASMNKPGNINCSIEVFNEFFLPIASCSARTSSNILSREFRNIYMLKNYLTYASVAFVILAILCAGAVFHEVKNITDNMASLETVRAGMPDIETVSSEYEAIENNIGQYKRVVEFINRPRPSMQRLLIELAGLDISGLSLDSLDARGRDDNSYSVTINGNSKGDTFLSMQTSFKKLIDSLDRIGGAKVIHKTFDLKGRTLRIELEYRATG